MSDDGKPTSLVALRDRREAVLQILADGFAGDLLNVDELDERVALAHQATTVAELDRLVADLAEVKPSTALVPVAVDSSLVPSTKRLRTLFGNIERKGPWVVPDRLQVKAIFGNAVLDLREAKLTAQTTVIDARVRFGNLEIIVPPQLAVDCEAEAVFGNVEHHGSVDHADPGRPILKIIGRATFGNIEVHVRLPGESARDTRKRLKLERKRAVPALPPKSTT